MSKTFSEQPRVCNRRRSMGPGRPGGGQSFLAVLGGCGTQTDHRDRTVEIEVGDVQLPDFVDPQSGSRQERVQVGSVAA